MLKHALRRDVAAARGELTPEVHDWWYRERVWSYLGAATFAVAGAVDEALWWLEHAVDLGWINYPLMAEKDPFLASVRSDPRFQHLMKQVKKEWEEFEV